MCKAGMDQFYKGATPTSSEKVNAFEFRNQVPAPSEK